MPECVFLFLTVLAPKCLMNLDKPFDHIHLDPSYYDLKLSLPINVSIESN